MKRVTYQDRDELAQWCVSIWRDAVSFKQTQAQVLACLARVYADPRWKRIPQYQHAYIHGYEACYRSAVIDRQFLEHGSWVRMPGGSAKWFGTAERVYQLDDTITHRYIYENAIAGRSGIYWVADPQRGTQPGEKPYFVSDNERVSEVAA